MVITEREKEKKLKYKLLITHAVRLSLFDTVNQRIRYTGSFEISKQTSG